MSESKCPKCRAATARADRAEGLLREIDAAHCSLYGVERIDTISTILFRADRPYSCPGCAARDAVLDEVKASLENPGVGSDTMFECIQEARFEISRRPAPPEPAESEARDD